ncbi:lariat debranching enzyme isoform X2 [Leptopilina boulardi]|uniref:lariat debranching enzyme isoform X2 n=1 Tax=Leptopilina boulardi TaxID=63433 RepID=UPI0021F61D1F|nr:lariat debranching enzyme isoform X2 [Leptopilina boulardi]
MRIAVEGCAHGELETIYKTIIEAEKVDKKKVDLLICCGDFQSTRNLCDLKCMAVPDKYKQMCSFYKYYSGELVAPVLTIFIGGNHEASNYLQELSYGGWVAPNIYYMGLASVVKVGNIRIAGLSGIYKGHDWLKGHFEKPPYTEQTIRSVYHVRNLEVFRLKQLSDKIDIFLSHDWPRGITKYGNERMLLKKKPFFRNDIENDVLGSPASIDLLKKHYPTYWFAAHLHCKFAALVNEEDGSRCTKFLALDKCLPRRKFLQIIDIEHDENIPTTLTYDLEWLTILFLTNHLLSVKNIMNMMPGEGDIRWIYTPNDEEKDIVLEKMNSDLKIPLNFIKTEEPYNPQTSPNNFENPRFQKNPQTTEFCNKLGIDDPLALLQLLLGIKEEKRDSSFSNTDLDSSYAVELDTSASETFDQTFESSLCTLDDDDECSPLAIKIKSESNLSKSISPLKLPPAKVNSPSQDSDLSQPVSQEPEQEEVAVAVAPIEPNLKRFKRRNQSIYSSQD